jgi:maltose alpha-D-glucosyltransferase/alpha-amylase
MGLDGFRADAVPYLFEREGTICENLPETHEYLKRLRKVVDEYSPKRLILSEANQWPEDVYAYYGDGDEVDMNFHFPIMPRIFKSLLEEDARSLIDIQKRTPAIPENTQWCMFLRNHDELTLEMVTLEERELLWNGYAPEDSMRLNLGIRRRLAPLLDNDMQKILLANSLLLTLPGSPVIYYGDELGMGDIHDLDDRNGVRTPMHWSPEPNAGFSTAHPDDLYSPVITEIPYSYSQLNVQIQDKDPDSMLNQIRRLLRIRKVHPSFSRGSFDWEKVLNNEAIAAYWRKTEDEILMVVHNLSASQQKFTLKMDMIVFNTFKDLVADNTHYVHHGNLELTLDPHQFCWLLRIE